MIMKAIINSPAQNLDASLAFYRKLEYRIITIDGIFYAIDGELIIRLDTRQNARAGMVLYTDLNKFSFDHFEKIHGVWTGVDPNGIYVFVKDISEYFQIEHEKSKALTGNFVGISIETLKFEGTIRYWEQFGYRVTLGSQAQGWIQMSAENNIDIGIMKYGSCPHSFRIPSMTFFNGQNNVAIIEKIKSSGIEIAEKITHFNKEGIVDNVVLADPGGYGIFVFSD